MSHLDDLICEYADARDIPFGEAEKVIMVAVKRFANKFGLSMDGATRHIDNATGEKVEGVLEEIRAKFSQPDPCSAEEHKLREKGKL